MQTSNQNIAVRKIIDVSKYNGAIDWHKVKSDGVTDVIIRLSLGFNTFDPNALTNANGAAAVGIKVSYYHFAYPDKRPGTVQGDAKQEANYFTGLFAGGKMPQPQWLAVDLENWGPDKDTPLTKQEYAEWLTIFLAEVKAGTGLTCMVYTYKAYLDQHLPPMHQFGSYPLWIANYNNPPTPPLPIGWKKYFLWQYSESGTVQGITGHCDLSKLG